MNIRYSIHGKIAFKSDLKIKDWWTETCQLYLEFTNYKKTKTHEIYIFHTSFQGRSNWAMGDRPGRTDFGGGSLTEQILSKIVSDGLDINNVQRWDVSYIGNNWIFRIT